MKKIYGFLALLIISLNTYFVLAADKVPLKIESGSVSQFSTGNTVGVANGGTGAATLTQHGVVIGNGTTAVNVTGTGTSGQVLTSNGASSDPTFQTLPSVGNTFTATAHENISAGAFIHMATYGGTGYVENANATTSSKPAQGFVLSAVTTGNPVTVYFFGQNNNLSAIATGTVYYLDTSAGGYTSTAPSGSGNLVQQLGVGLDGVTVQFQPTAGVTLQ